MYVADENNHRIRKITVSTGIISTIAGSGTNGYSGDNVQASSAALSTPTGVALDTSGTSSTFFIFFLLFLIFNFCDVTRQCLHR